MSQSDRSVTAPKRRLRRRPAAVFLFVMVLALLWLAWWRVAEHQLAARLAAMRAAGEPIEPGDFVQPTLPPGENAAKYYRQAIALLSATQSPSNVLEEKDYAPYPPDWLAMMKAAMPANANALAMARRASQIQQVDWQFVVGSSQVGLTVGGARQLAHTLSDAALDDHVHGDDAEATQRVLDVLHLANAVATRSGLLGRMVGLGIEAMGLHRLRTILPDLEVNPSVGESSPLRADPRVLRQMIGMLLDERPTFALAREDFVMERSANYMELLKVRDRTTMLRPLVDQEIARVFDDWQTKLKAVDTQNWTQALSPPPAPTTTSQASWLFWGESPDHARYSRVVSSAFGPNDRFLTVEARLSAERRAAAVAIAICLYRTDHHQWPKALDDLVPNYLPSVPLDPTVVGGQPIGYVILHGALPNGGDRPMLYFYALPSTASPPSEPCFGWTTTQGRWQDGIQWRDLSRWFPSFPMTAPADSSQ